MSPLAFTAAILCAIAAATFLGLGVVGLISIALRKLRQGPNYPPRNFNEDEPS